MTIKIYGTGWCTKTGLMKNHLQSEWLDFEYYNVEEDEEAASYIRSLFNGKLKFPVVTVGETVLLNPTVGDVNAALKK